MRTLLLAAGLTLATAAGAQTPATKPAPATKPGTAAAAAPKRTATITTKAGKKMTYDCTKKGNMNKAACKH